MLTEEGWTHEDHKINAVCRATPLETEHPVNHDLEFFSPVIMLINKQQEKIEKLSNEVKFLKTKLRGL